MKHSLFIIAMLFTFKVAAQQQIERKDFKYGEAPANYLGWYISDSRLDKFIGLWKWEEGNEVFMLSLEKIEKFDMQKEYKLSLIMDIIQGKYFFKENGQTPNPEWDDYLFMKIGTTDNEYTLGFVLRDEYNDWIYSGTMKLDADNPNRAYFKFHPMEKVNIYVDGEPIAKKENGVKIPGGVLRLEGKPITRVNK